MPPNTIDNINKRIDWLYKQFKCLDRTVSNLEPIVQNNLLLVRDISFDSNSETFLDVLNATVTEVSERQILVVNATDTSDNSQSKYISKVGKGTFGGTNTQFVLTDFEDFTSSTDNIYTVSGSIPTNTSRTITLDANAELDIQGTNSYFYIENNSVELLGADVTLEDYNGDNGIYFTNGQPLNIYSDLGVRLSLPTAPVNTNQVLGVSNLSGDLLWVDVDSSPFIEVNEGNGIGQRLASIPAANVGDIGLYAFDRGEYYSAGTTEGALATHSFIGNGDSNSISGNAYGGYTLGGGANSIAGNAVGAGALGNFNNIIEGYGAIAGGAYNTINVSNLGGGVLALGHGNTVTGQFPLGTIGLALNVNSRNHLAVGVSNTVYGGGTSDANRPLFTVGNGTHSTPFGQWLPLTASDAFVVRYDGSVEAPSITNTLINSIGAKSLLSKEYWDGILNYNLTGDLIAHFGDWQGNGNGTEVIVDDDAEEVQVFGNFRISDLASGFDTLIGTSNLTADTSLQLPNNAATQTIPVSVNGTFADANGEITIATGGASYSVFTCNVTQNGTTGIDIITNQLEDTLPGIAAPQPFTSQRTGVGIYRLSPKTGLTIDPTTTTVTIKAKIDFPPNSGNEYHAEARFQGGEIWINTFLNGTLSDGCLENSFFEVRVY